MADAYFSTATLDFLQDLEVNNDKRWFEANRSRYEEHVREPMRRFITDLQAPMKRIAPHVIVDPRGNGGSMFRINRDIRFSADKSPYKTNTGAQFRHEDGKDVHAPGFYLHIEPGNCGMAAGMWTPPTATLNEVRQRIVDEPGQWTRTRNAVVKAGYEFHGGEDMLKRAPKGFDPDHQHIEDLRRKSYAVWQPLTDAEVTSDAFLTDFVERCATAKPLMTFLCKAIDAPW